MIVGFFRGLSFILITNIAVKLVWVLGVEVAVQNRFGVELYGSYYNLYNISLLFGFLMDPGISKYQNLMTSLDGRHTMWSINTMNRLKIGLSILYLLVTFLVSYTVLEIENHALTLLLVLCMSQIFRSYMMFFRASFVGMVMYLWEGFFSVADRLIMIILFCVWMYTHLLEPSIDHFIWIQWMGYGVSFLLSVGVITNIITKSKEDRSQALLPKHTYKLLLPFVFYTGIEMLNYRGGIIMLGVLLPDGDTQVGWYAYGQRLLDAFCMFVAIFSWNLIPQYVKGKLGELCIRSLVRYSFYFFFLPLVVVLTFLFWHMEEFSLLMYNKSSDYMTAILTLNLLSFLPYMIVFILTPLWLVFSRVKHLTLLFALFLIIHVLISIFLVNEYKAVAISLSVALVTTLSALCLFIFAPVKLVTSRFFIQVLQVILFVSLINAGCYILKDLIPWYGQLISIVGLGVVLIFVLKFISIADVKNILVSEKKIPDKKR